MLSYKAQWSLHGVRSGIDGIIFKGKCIIIPNYLKEQVLNQLHTNHMGIEKTRLLAWECVYWPSINADIEKYIKQCPTCLQFQQTQPQERIIHHDTPLWPWEVFWAYVFHNNNKNYLCIIDYNSKFLIIKRLEGLSAENLTNAVKIIFTEYGIPCKIMSDAGTNFVSDKFQKFCRAINIEQATLSAYHHQSNRQVEACIKFIKWTFKKCAKSSRDINMALLQIDTTPLGPGLPSPATLLFNRQVWGIMSVLDHKPIRQDCDDNHYGKLMDRQQKNDNDTPPVFPCIPTGSAVMVQQEDGRPWTYGTVVDSGNHNHHGTSYIIQLTTNGRCITWNRWHIKPTTVTADTYLKHQSHKHYKKSSSLCCRQTTNDNEQCNRKQEEEAKDNEHCSMEASNITKQLCTQVAKDNRTIIKYGDTIRTRSGHISKKTGQIGIQIIIKTGPANMSAAPKMYSQQCYSTILSVFLYDILCWLLASQHIKPLCIITL